MLTLLIHLGYLAYDKETGTACIPNEEIRLEFARTVRRVKRDDTIRRVKESDQLILDIIHGNAEAVAAQGAIAQIRERRYPEALAEYGGEILLVGISYEKEGKKGERKHTCVIERTKAS